jgi:hypothetical protein
MSKPPTWPFKCPRGHGWYLSDVQAIFPEDCNLENCGCDPATPLLVYGTCKQHGRVWLGDKASYEPEIWRKDYELRQVEWAERTTSVYDSYLGGITCCGCLLQDHMVDSFAGEHPDFRVDTHEAMIRHVREHQKAGHAVPDFVIPRLAAAMGELQ